MKKLFAILITLLLLCSIFTGCGNKESNTTTQNPSDNTATQEQEETKPIVEDILTGYVTMKLNDAEVKLFFDTKECNLKPFEESVLWVFNIPETSNFFLSLKDDFSTEGMTANENSNISSNLNWKAFTKDNTHIFYTEYNGLHIVAEGEDLNFLQTILPAISLK